MKNREGDFKKRAEDCTQTRISISNHTIFTPNHHIFAKIELIKFAHCIFNGLSGFMESKCPNFAISWAFLTRFLKKTRSLPLEFHAFSWLQTSKSRHSFINWKQSYFNNTWFSTTYKHILSNLSVISDFNKRKKQFIYIKE